MLEYVKGKTMNKSDIRINDVISDHNLSITMKGSLPHIICPFHSDTDPSMAIYEKTNSAYCYACNTSASAEYLKATLMGVTVANLRKKMYGNDYEFRALNSEIKEYIEVDEAYMLERLAIIIRTKTKNCPTFIEHVPKLLARVVQGQLTYIRYIDYLNEIRNFKDGQETDNDSNNNRSES